MFKDKKNRIYVICLATLVFLGSVFYVLIPSISKLNSQYSELRKEELVNKLSLVEELYRRQKINDVTLRAYEKPYFELAKLYLKEKNFDKAIELYTRGLKINCWKAKEIFELACAYANTGSYRQAYEKFTQVLSLKPSFIVFLRTKWELMKVSEKRPNIEIVQEETRVSPEKIKDLTIYILPFGVNDIEMLRDLRVLLQEAFKIRFEILNPMAETEVGFDKERNQYFVEPLLKYVRKEYESISWVPGTQSIMIITSFDITEKGLNFLFGRTDEKTNLGIVSYRRFLLDKPDDKLLFKRLFTQSLSTGGFLLGLPRCGTPACARTYPHSFSEFKRKSAELCEVCRSSLDKFLAKIKDYPEIDWAKEDMLRLEKVKDKYNF